MDIKEMEQGEWRDLFPEASEGGNNGTPNATFKSDASTADLFTDVASVGETTTLAPEGSTDTTTTIAPTTDDVDIVGEAEEGKKAGRKAKYDFSDASGYFADRFKSGKFVAITETNEKGESVPFIPRNPEEFDEVIDIQVNYKLEQERKELEGKIYSSKSPAWQAALKYSEMVDDPSELLPFLQGIKTIQSVANFDENEIEGAEQIVRARLEQRGESQDVIDEQIDALKTTDKLISTAKKYKPSILQEEQRNLQQMTEQKRREEAQYIQLVNEIRDNAVKEIDTPLFGKYKLKDQEKYAVYEMIGEPSEETSGYGIYNAIDNLFEKRDFETLKLAALLLTNKEALINYISTGAANQTSEKIQRQLRVATESRSGMSNDEGFNEPSTTVNRTQYNRTAKFGRK